MARTQTSKRVNVYIVYEKGQKIGEMVLTTERMKDLERAGYRFKIKNPLTRSKARTILEHGEVGGRKLTKRQKGFFGARAAGLPQKNPGGLTKIYQSITRIEGTKGNDSHFPGEKFFHNFKRPYPSMYGDSTKKILIIK